MSRILIVVLKFLPVALIVLGSLGCKSGFSDSDIEAVRASIRSELVGKGMIVSEVSMVKVSDRKLKGFAKVKMPTYETAISPYGLNRTYRTPNDVELTKDCIAEMSTDNKNYFWKCQ